MYCPNRDCPDFKDTGKPGEYREGITRCPYCRSALVAEDPLRAAPPAPAAHRPEPGGEWEPGGRAAAAPGGDELEPVFESSDPSEVPVVRSFLDAHGIPHVVVGEERFDAFRGSLSAFRFNPRAGVVAFMVPAEYAEIARDLLGEFEGEPPEGG
jgi:hypothetical protein